jgi:hypothetical protein
MGALTLIGSLQANQKMRDVHDRFPATDEHARIVLSPADGTAFPQIRVRAVYPIYVDWKRRIFAPEFQAGIDAVRDMNWTITFTDERIILWSPFIMNARGEKGMVKGRATGGHIKYLWLKEMIVSNEKRPYVFAINAGNSAKGEDKTACFIEAPADILSLVVKQTAQMLLRYRKNESERYLKRLKRNLKQLADVDWSKGRSSLFYLWNENAIRMVGSSNIRQGQTI